MEWFNPFGGEGGGGGGPSDAYTKAETNELLNQKVDKVSGKGLSTEDYTTEDKAKVDNLGTAAERDVPASGDAANDEVVLGNDSRLTDARPASDVSEWAKALTKPTYSYDEITGKPTINGVIIEGDLTLEDLELYPMWVGTQAEYEIEKDTIDTDTVVIITDDQDVDNVPTQSSTNLVYSGGVYTFVTQGLSNKVDKETGKGLSTEDYTTAEKTKLAGLTNDYTDHTNKPQINSVTLSGNKTSLDLGLLPSSTKYGTSISVTINDSTYVVTAILKDQDGNTLGTAQTIDLPLESMVVGGEYDDTTKKIILTLKNGQTVEFSVADLVAGLQTEITSSNKLNADLVDDTNTTNKFVSAAEKTSIGTSATKLTGVDSSATNYIQLANGKRLYLSDAEPTGTIPEGAFWIGGTVST